MRPAVAAASAVLLGVAGVLVGCSSQGFEDPEVAFTTVEDADESDEAAAAADSEPAEAEAEPAEKRNDEPAPAPKKEKESDNASRSDAANSQYITQVGLGEAIADASYPACDGRYILIVDSIVDDPSLGDTRKRLTDAVMFGSDGKEFTVPGRCDSLRKERYGHVIYPVYIDFGSDVNAACSAKARLGGNVRPLRNGNFGDGTNVDVDEARLALDPC